MNELSLYMFGISHGGAIGISLMLYVMLKFDLIGCYNREKNKSPEGKE